MRAVQREPEGPLNHEYIQLLMELSPQALRHRGETRLISRSAQPGAQLRFHLNHPDWEIPNYQPRHSISREIVQQLTQTPLVRKLLTPFLDEERQCGTYDHCHRVAELACDIAIDRRLTDWEIIVTTAAALVHDAGKISEPDSFWTKPGRFTDEERQTSKKHVVEGSRLLREEDRPELEPIMQLVARHHEFHKDGYPNRLTMDDYLGAEPDQARILECLMILTAADFFDALQDPYRHYQTKALNLTEVQGIMQEHFTGDHELIQECLKRIRPSGQKLSRMTG